MGMMRVTPAEMKSCWLPALAPVCIHDLVGKMEILVTGETSVPVPDSVEDIAVFSLLAVHPHAGLPGHISSVPVVVVVESSASKAV